MKIATWNVNSIAARLEHVLLWLNRVGPDVLCLQEIKCTDDKFPAAAFESIGYRSAVFGQKTYNGVAILSRFDLKEIRRGFPDDGEEAQSRLIAATIEDVRVINVYVPNGSEVGSDKFKYKLDWLQRLRSFLDQSCDNKSDVLICGDFNVAPDERDVHDPREWAGKILFSKPERAAIDYVKRWGFTDAFRLHTEEGGHFSWWDYRAASFLLNQGLRIDHIWISDSLTKRCTAAAIDKEPRAWERPSDHTPVVATFSDKE